MIKLMNKVNEVLISKRRKVVVTNGVNTDDNIQYIATIMKNIEHYGFIFSEEVVESLKTLDKSSLISFYTDLIEVIKPMLGADKDLTPMYPNFPQQVMGMDVVELYFNAIIHYISGGTLYPATEVKERFPLIDSPELTVLSLGTMEDFYSVFTNLVGANGSISSSDKELVEWYMNTFKEEMEPFFPEKIPNKENLSYITNLVMSIEGLDVTKILSLYFKTATDILRLATSMSSGDVSLSTKTKFKSFSRKERRLLLGLLEKVGNMEEDMARYKYEWIKLGEKLHPSEYKQFERVNKTFHKLRNNIKIHTYYSKLEKAFAEKDVEKMVQLLTKRPGEFARNLRQALSLGNTELTLNAFREVAVEVNMPVLLQVRAYFISMCKGVKPTMRVFFPKGSVATLYGIENKLQDLDVQVCRKVVRICSEAIKTQLSTREELKNVFIDPELKNFIVPTSQRTASKTLKTVARGSRMKFKKGTKTLRTFIYWKQPKNDRTDIDLSMVFLNDKYEKVTEIAYYNLRCNKFDGICHSGDITSAPDGAAEFIDMDIELLKKQGIRYAMMCVNSYTYQPFANLPECFAGIMEREDLMSGEVFEPKTVSMKADVSNGSDFVVPLVIDFEDNVMIWTDLAINRNVYECNNVGNNTSALTLTMEAMLNVVKPNLYDLFILHARARGKVVKNKEEADIVYGVDGDITQYDTDIIMGTYL